MASSASLSFEFTNISIARFVFALAQLNLFVFRFHIGGGAVFRRDGEACVFSAWQDWEFPDTDLFLIKLNDGCLLWLERTLRLPDFCSCCPFAEVADNDRSSYVFVHVICNRIFQQNHTWHPALSIQKIITGNPRQELVNLSLRLRLSTY